MTTLIAIYRGDSIASARLVYVSADPVLAADIATRLLGDHPASPDPAVAAVEQGRRQALRVIRAESEHTPSC